MGDFGDEQTTDLPLLQPLEVTARVATEKTIDSPRNDDEMHDGWQRVIEYYYSGRLLTLFRVGQVVRTTRIGKIMNFHLSKYMPRIFTREAAHSRYSLGLVSFMSEYGLAGNDPDLLRIN